MYLYNKLYFYNQIIVLNNTISIDKIHLGQYSLYRRQLKWPLNIELRLTN